MTADESGAWQRRLKERMRELGMSGRDLARVSGVKYDSVAGYAQGRVQSPRGDIMEKLAKALGASPAWLRFGIGDPPPPVRSDSPAGLYLAGQPQIDLVSGTGQSQNPHADETIAKLIEIDVRRGGRTSGGGTLIRVAERVSITEDSAVSQWFVPRTYLMALGAAPGSAFIFEVLGDSMFDPANPGAPGSLFPGDKVIVDVADRTPSPAGPFLIWDGIGLVVKQVEITGFGGDPIRLRLSSRNPAYAPYEATSVEIAVVGRLRGKISRL